MCGIAGFVGAGELCDLKAMTDAQVHRGPDDEGHWCNHDKGVFLGHRRLSILDLGGGHQPMWTANRKLGIVFNGEIYNFKELRDELTALGFQFQTDHSDTEVLLNGYLAWGRELVLRLNGMWAFAIYDAANGVLFCSRDRFGKKPFYYAVRQGTLIFASELSALMKHPLLRGASISRPSLQKYFAYNYIPAPRTIYEDVWKLPGGHNLEFKITSRDLAIRKYWDFVLEPTENIPQNAEEIWGEQLRALLDKAVSRRLMADVPVGVFLSGGVDSSAVAAFASRHVPQGSLKTFSIGFDEADFDESVYAAKVASLLETDHFIETLSVTRAKSLATEIIARLDEPMGDVSLLPTCLLCGHTRKHVTVALGGDGADELFAGYDPFKAIRLAELYQRIVPSPVHEGIRHFFAKLPVSHGYMSLDFKIKRTLRGLSYPQKYWSSVWMSSLDSKELEEMFQEPIDLESLFSEAIELWDACRQNNLIDRTLQYYTKLYLQDDILVKVDRASMMHSLEARSPFLDIELIDWVRTIPSNYKFRNGQTKYILKKALEPVLPREVLYRRKQGFGVPIGKWIVDGMFERRPDAMLTSPDFYNKKYRNHMEGLEDQRAFIWNDWVLNHWHATRQS